MDLLTNIKQRNEAMPQQVYIIQLDPNVQIESQAIPLHILENKQLQQPLLLIEPLEEFNGRENKTEQEHKNARINSVRAVASVDNDKNKSNMFQNQINAMFEQNIQNTTVTDLLVNFKNGIEEINKSKPCDFKVEIQVKKIGVKQKSKNYVHISDVKVPPRAIAVLPAVFQIRGKWISPRRTLSAWVRFGPVQGIHKSITRSEAKKLFSNMTAPVFLLNQDKDHVIHIDVSDKDKSNWIGLLPLGDISTPTTPTTANVWIYEECSELYAVTTQPIGARRPLRLGYSQTYVEEHEIPRGPPVLDLETASPVQWWCNECNRALASASLLQRHTDVYHKDDIKSWQSSYRCRYCKRPFSRLFTLKRHMLNYCEKRHKKTAEKTQQSTELNPEPDISSVLDDNRIPSDESFHNFTNSLDFSTNLFDTDRMAGLDISGHSRADSELNPFSIGFRDDNGLSNDLDFTKLSTVTENVQSTESNQEKTEPLLDTCAYCNQVLVKENKSKHLRQCPSRLICECGRVFRHKQSLAQHINKCHPSEKQTKTDKKKPEDKEMAYKCQECPFGFKRRGMLVNHLWRIHKKISTTPVEKKVRHYPCVACPKIYRSATKRNLHVKVHHPGAENLRAQSIEGGVKSCQPASCSECPRQYVTRAKLLQHVRAQHPHLAKAMKQQTMKKQTKSTTKVKNKEATENTFTSGDQLQFDFY